MMVMASFLMFSCSDDDASNETKTIEKIETHLKSGTWRITKFIDSGNDETSDFTGYNFTFASNGVLTTTNGVTTYTGTWSISKSSSDDDSYNNLDFNIYFNLTNQFEELNDDWDFISNSPSKIELIDISGGNGGTDYLTFEKN